MVMRIISKNNNTLPCFDKVDKVICAALSHKLHSAFDPLQDTTPKMQAVQMRALLCFFSRFALFRFVQFNFALLGFVLLCSAQLCSIQLS